MQTGFSGTLIGWKSGQTTFVPLWVPNGGSVAALAGRDGGGPNKTTVNRLSNVSSIYLASDDRQDEGFSSVWQWWTSHSLLNHNNHSWSYMHTVDIFTPFNSHKCQRIFQVIVSNKRLMSNLCGTKQIYRIFYVEINIQKLLYRSPCKKTLCNS